MDGPNVEAHFYLGQGLNNVRREVEDQWRTRSFISLIVPVKLWTTPPLAPADRPPSAPNPSSCRMDLKSSCAARECKKRGRRCFFASESWVLVVIVYRSTFREPSKCLTEMPSSVSLRLRNANGRSLNVRAWYELRSPDRFERTKPTFSNGYNATHSTKVLRDDLIELCEISLGSRFWIVAHLRASRGMASGGSIESCDGYDRCCVTD